MNVYEVYTLGGISILVNAEQLTLEDNGIIRFCTGTETVGVFPAANIVGVVAVDGERGCPLLGGAIWDKHTKWPAGFGPPAKTKAVEQIGV